MDFKEQIKLIGANVSKLKDSIQTEEATKTAFIMPFIQALGYNVFNPLEVIPEFTADLGTKQGEKVDYAILKDERPILLIECKKIGTDLNLDNENQLFRYFHASNVKFAILTNGEYYKFYSDIEQENKMDKTPFLAFNITKIKENQITELRKFCKDNFDFDKILDSATTLKYSNAVREAIKTELNEPSDEFLAVFIKKAYSGRITKKVLEQFNEIVKYSFKQFIDDGVTERLQNAIKAEAEQQTPPPQIEEENLENNGIITTEEELEAFRIVRAILCDKIPIEKVHYKDTQSYFGILYDNKVTKWICRLRLSENRKILSFPTSDKSEEKIEISDISELYKYKDKILQSALIYCEQK